MKYLAFLLLLLFKFMPANAQTAWTNLDTGIDDNLTGVVFLQSNGLASGEHGLYYTTTGGEGPASWTRLQITDAVLSAIYENTKFTHCYTDHSNTNSTGIVYACGQDLATTRAVILRISLPSMACQLKYSGELNTKLNKIDYSTNSLKYVAVGDGGLMLSFNGSSLFTLSSGTTDDLTSLNFDSSAVFYYGSYGKVRRAYLESSSISAMIQSDVPDAPIKDISMKYSVGGDYMLSTDFFPTSTLRKTYYHGPLVMNGIYADYGFIWVGTNQGIYRSNVNTGFLTSALELQPETANYQINEFFKPQFGSIKYACGNNGVILRTSLNGGNPKPYVKITSVNGGCYPGSVTFSALYGTATGGNWYSNGVLFHTGLGNFSHSFTAVGTYTISLVVSAYGVQNTDTISFTVVNPPDVTKTVTLSDNLLCKQETIQVSVANSEPNVIYSLRQGSSTTDYGISQPGTGGLLTFDATIDVTGDYYVYAKSSLAACGRRFAENLHITVEETKADFHSGLINAKVNEVVDFYENSVDSQNFQWSFGPNATVATSTNPNTQTAFTAVGEVTSSLHSWSNNGCHDTVAQHVPNLYEVPANPADCFLLRNDSTDPNWPGYYNPDISQMIPTATGFFACGTYYNEVFDSRFGVTLSMPGKKGGYMSKYDKNGVLRWMVYTVNPSTINTNDYVMYNTAEDLNGNIYVSGKGNGKFYDNAGHVTDLGNMLKYFLIKLNPKGEIIWYAQNNLFGYTKMMVDKENNLVVLTDFVTEFQTVQLYLNGATSTVIGQQVTSPETYYATNEIIKFSPTGAVIWDTKVYLDSVNNRELTDIGIDIDSNIYVAMSFDIQAKIYQVGTTATQTIAGDGRYGGKLGIVKFNKNGQIVWKMRSRTTNIAGTTTDLTTAEKMIVQDDGTIYIAGSNSTGGNWYGPLNYTHRIESANGSVVTTTNGPYYVAKINSSGICQWLRAAGHTYYGYGYQVLISGNEVYVMGMMSNNNENSCSGTFDSANSNSYNLTIGASDYFISVYDTSGNLKRIFVNGSNANDFAFSSATGFFKDGNHFYLAKNNGYYLAHSGYSDFGLTVPVLNERDGLILRFTEACGISRYDADNVLNSTGFSALQNSVLAPNPTTGKFNIRMNHNFDEVILAIYDIAGKLISQENYTNVAEITSMVKAETGIYFIKLKTSEGEKCFKLIKT